MAGRVFATLPEVRRFFDVNLRRDSYTPELAAELMRRADVLKLNEEEMRVLAPVAGAPSIPSSASASSARGSTAVKRWR